jgi:hypothetical protein
MDPSSTPPQVPPALFDLKIIGYLVVASMLGLLSAFAALVGTESKEITWRTMVAYTLAGALVSAGVTFLLVEAYGFSYFLLGVSIFAGYKAFDTLAIVGMATANIAKKVMELVSTKK